MRWKLAFMVVLVASCTNRSEVGSSPPEMAVGEDSSLFLEKDTAVGPLDLFPLRNPPFEDVPRSLRVPSPPPPQSLSNDVEDIRSQLKALEEYTRERAEKKVPASEMHDLEHFERKNARRKTSEE